MKPFENLPHRQPFAMLDSVEVIEEGKCARGLKMITINDTTTSPDGLFPQVLIIEAMAQTSGIATGNKKGSMLAAIKHINFDGIVLAGDILDIESILERTLGNLYIFSAKASVSNKTVARGNIILYFE